jgi:Zn-dependent M28 family amino/carboxypeptidase
VPGANDNLSGVAVLLELARALDERPVEGVRVLLVSTGSEESFMEGMRGFARRHFPGLPPERTEVICLDSVGSPELILIEGEGMLRMRDYTPELRDRVAAVAARAGVHLRRRLRLGLATDGLIALKAGYPSAAIGSVTKYKLPLNYHSPRDTAEALHYETVRDAATLCEALVREAAS